MPIADGQLLHGAASRRMRPASMLTVFLLFWAAAASAANPTRKLAQMVAPAIVNGKDSARVGWYVSLGRKLPNGGWASYCGGMLITQTVVLTAAHCAFNAEDNVMRPPATVAIGMRSRDNSSQVNVATVKRTIPHPRYQPGPGSRFATLGFDIALLELDPTTVSDKNELVALPAYVPKPSNPVPAGTRLALIGLGDLGNGTVPNTLQRTDVLLSPLETCNEAYANWADVADFFTSTAICAGPPRTNRFTDACPGDSGGPLYAPRTAGHPYDTAIGLVSYGEDCDILYDKTRYGRPGVYTNIAQLRPWVNANLACLAQNKTCPWGGTCFEYPANGCATCQPGIGGNPTFCATCKVAGYVVDTDNQSRQLGQCRPKDCRDVVKHCIACSRRSPFQCAACNYGYKVVNNQCVLKTCLDYDRGCSQCDPATPVICAACKRYHTLDPATGQCLGTGRV